MKYDNTLKLIGNTPILKLPNENIYLKLEKFNPGGSIKDRTALGMILDAEKKKLLRKDSIIIEPTSGNTGIGLALIGRLKGYKVVIVMPDTMSTERRNIIKAYGAKLILTDGKEGMNGAIENAQNLVKKNNKYFMPDQFNNPANSQMHYNTTAVEIINDIKDIDIFTAAVGTGGSFTGIAKRLKEYNKKIITAAVEPEKSAVLSGREAGRHRIQGIGAGFVPKIYKPEYNEEIIQVKDEEAEKTAVEISLKTGILVGISTGANIVAARKLAEKYGQDKKIVTISPDGGEKYLSTGIYTLR